MRWWQGARCPNARSAGERPPNRNHPNTALLAKRERPSQAAADPKHPLSEGDESAVTALRASDDDAQGAKLESLGSLPPPVRFFGAAHARVIVHLAIQMWSIDPQRLLRRRRRRLRRARRRAESLEHPPGDIFVPSSHELDQSARRGSINHCCLHTCRRTSLCMVGKSACNALLPTCNLVPSVTFAAVDPLQSSKQHSCIKFHCERACSALSRRTFQPFAGEQVLQRAGSALAFVIAALTLLFAVNAGAQPNEATGTATTERKLGPAQRLPGLIARRHRLGCGFLLNRWHRWPTRRRCDPERHEIFRC